MKYDHKTTTLFSLSYLRELGEYAGEFQAEAFEALELHEDLQENEWCDVMGSENGKIYAVFGDTEAHNFGNFYFKEIDDSHPKYPYFASKLKEVFDLE